MAPTKPMTPGNVYIFDYITNKADLDDQELNGKSLGTDYCYIPCEHLRGLEDEEGELEYYPGGHGFFFRYDQDENDVITGGNHLTKAEQGYIRQYKKLHRKDGNNPDYLVFYRAANDFYLFYQDDGDEVQYCRGWFKKILTHGWDSGIPQLYSIQTLFKEVWS